MSSYPKWFFIFSVGHLSLLSNMLLANMLWGGMAVEGKISASQVFVKVNGRIETVQSVLDSLTPKDIKLKDLTATVTELNALGGISGGNVNADNLKTLTGGSSSDADQLHTHLSGIGNASTLDNLDSAQFLRADLSDTFEGDLLTLNGDMELTSGGKITSSSNGNITIDPNGSGGIQLGTSTNTTAVTLAGDLSVSGDINNPTLQEIVFEIHSLKEEVRTLKTMLQIREEQ